MKTLVTKWFATAVVDGERVVLKKEFPAEAHAIAERILRIRRGEILEEERALAGPGIAVSEERLRPLGTVRLPEGPVRVGGAPDRALLREAAMLVARDEFRRVSAERDRFVVQAVRAMDEITRTANTLMERLRDWYALHFPESIRRVTDSTKFAKLLATNPERGAVAKSLGQLAPDDSIGAAFTQEELAAVKGFASSIGTFFGERERLEALVEREARAVAPTLAGMVGPLIAARLISQANGLQRLAMLPASTVQTLGAENALFLHLKEGNPPPKHGILFQHPLVNTAPRWQRGRVARLLASAASQAARVDWFSPDGGDRSAPLKAGVETRLVRLRARPPPAPKPRRRPPPRPVAPQARPRGRRR